MSGENRTTVFFVNEDGVVGDEIEGRGFVVINFEDGSLSISSVGDPDGDNQVVLTPRATAQIVRRISAPSTR